MIDRLEALSHDIPDSLAQTVQKIAELNRLRYQREIIYQDLDILRVRLNGIRSILGKVRKYTERKDQLHGKYAVLLDQRLDATRKYGQACLRSMWEVSRLTSLLEGQENKEEAARLSTVYQLFQGERDLYDREIAELTAEKEALKEPHDSLTELIEFHKSLAAEYDAKIAEYDQITEKGNAILKDLNELDGQYNDLIKEFFEIFASAPIEITIPSTDSNLDDA